MMPRHEAFGRMLSQAIYIIKMLEDKNLSIVQDELGYALQRKGGSAVERWRKGHLPPSTGDVEMLARILIGRSQGHLSRQWLETFLNHAKHPYPGQVVEEIFTPPPQPKSDDGQAAPINALRSLPSPQNQARLAPPIRQRTSESARMPAINGLTLADDLPESPITFIAGPPILHPRAFFGRERELKQIFHRLQGRPLQHVAVMGARRSGKTSLLHYLKQITRTPAAELRPGQQGNWLPHLQRYQWVFIDFQDSRMLRQATLLNHLLEQLGIPAPEPCELSTFMEAVSENLQMPAVLLLDKIEAALAAPELDLPFWWNLRSLVTNQTAGKLGIIVTSHKPPAELAQDYGKPSPFFNIFGYALTLGPLTESEARELIASSPIPFSEADTTWILAQSKRWPALLQILCTVRLIALETGQWDDGWQEDGLRQISPYRQMVASDE